MNHRLRPERATNSRPRPWLVLWLVPLLWGALAGGRPALEATGPSAAAAVALCAGHSGAADQARAEAAAAQREAARRCVPPDFGADEATAHRRRAARQAALTSPRLGADARALDLSFIATLAFALPQVALPHAVFAVRPLPPSVARSLAPTPCHSPSSRGPPCRLVVA